MLRAGRSSLFMVYVPWRIEKNKGEINTMERGKRRAHQVQRQGFPNGLLLAYHSRCRFER